MFGRDGREPILVDVPCIEDPIVGDRFDLDAEARLDEPEGVGERRRDRSGQGRGR